MVFFDEIDAIVAKRAASDSSQTDKVQERVLSTLLNEMDGIEAATGVLVVGATNRPNALDAALMRPGRFDEIIYVPPPDEQARLKILQIYTKHLPLDGSVDLSEIASKVLTSSILRATC